MKVLLIAPPIMDFVDGDFRPIAMDAVRECPPYGIYLLASVLRDAGHDAILADLIADGSRSLQPYETHLHDCQLVGISATSMSWSTALDVIHQVRAQRPEVPIVLGGIHPTMFDYYLLDTFPVDFIIRGEGEEALLALCAALERGRGPGEVPNLSWRTPEGKVVRNPVAPKIPADQLGRYALPDFSQLPRGMYKGLSIESSRGCAFDCSFCSTSYRLGWRGIPPKVFVDRLERMIPHTERTALGIIHIVDDEFSMNPRRAIEITDVIRQRGLCPSFVYDSRATDLLFDGYVPSIAEFTNQFLIGAECGYDEGLKLIGKGTTTKILEDAARLLYRHDMSRRADFSFILGLPWETEKEVKRTCQFATHLVFTYGVRVLLQWYCQIPGSRLWEEDRRQELVCEALYDDYGFFSNLYLFRTGVKLTPAQIWEISHTVNAVQKVAAVKYPDLCMIEYGHPEPIAAHFPEDLLGSRDDGLASLREVARPPAEGARKVFTQVEPRGRTPIPVGRPLRHLGI